MTTLAAKAAREVVELHALFVELFTGRSHDFTHCEKAFAADFEMVTPDGRRLTRSETIEGLRKARADEDFRISIHDLRPIRELRECVLLHYVEEQYRDGKTTRRRSVALFEPANRAPHGVAWRFLQETWISV